MQLMRHLLGTMTLLAVVVAAQALAGTTREQQRETFVQAERALQLGRSDEYARLRGALRDYPLAAYLDYTRLSDQFGRASLAEIRSFLKREDGTPIGWRLRARWLDHLAKRGRWNDYLEFYRADDSVSRRCHHLNALIQTGRKAAALPQVKAIWLHGSSRPDACDPVFTHWEKAGLRTPELTWKRIALAMHKGELKLAHYLARGLDTADQRWVDRWIRIYRNPEEILAKHEFSQAHPYREPMLQHATMRLAADDGLRALDAWQQVRGRYPFNAEQIHDVERRIVLALIRSDDAAAYDFVQNAQPHSHDDRLQEARILSALAHTDWNQVRKQIAALPAPERQTERWQYWAARALQALGQPEQAQQLFTKLGSERSYYGFLAADHAGREYHLTHTDTPIDTEVLKDFATNLAVQRATELFALERWTDARREWRYATRSLDDSHLMAAAKYAQNHGWYDQAIFTLARTGFWDDLELRFPLQHAPAVASNAQRQAIEGAWIFAVMRQESAFMHNAHSHAGAVGLMQLMPATARLVATRQLGRKPPSKSELLQPETNISLGSGYLRMMLDQLNDNPVLATAAYNAGPHRVKRWLPEHGMPGDIWIELVPFRETRGYLQRVLSYTAIYENRLGGSPTRLLQKMQEIGPEHPVSVQQTAQATPAT